MTQLAAINLLCSSVAMEHRGGSERPGGESVQKLVAGMGERKVSPEELAAIRELVGKLEENS